jgi:outer membrane lipoprotein-sorting protein
MDERGEFRGFPGDLWGKRWAWLTAAFFLFGMFAGGQPPPVKAPEDLRLDALVRRMDEVQKEIQTLKVSFVQSNQFRMLKEPQVLKGVLVLRKPDTALYRYASPSPLIFLVKDGDLLVYNPAQKRVMVQDIRRHQGRIVRYLGISQPMDELAQNFEVVWAGEENGVAFLQLVPRKLRVKRKISVLNFWVDEKTALLKSFEVVEAEGDRIRFDFSQWEINPHLGEEAFKVEIPPGVKVHRQVGDVWEPFKP